ncbi:NADH-dependent flavin oxidoreductase [Mesomycoplasma conjunctivae]|uniref:oxidoreductase n=1 Tax=Mesomycoplasma conjunctivae TaxID=45361 RepID=UPI003DA43368
MKKKVFEHFYIKNRLLKNRFVNSPINLNLAKNGFVCQEDINFALRRAHSAAITITGGLYVSENGRLFDYGIGISDDKFIPGLSALAEAMKKKGSLAIAQLIHAGSHSLAFLKDSGYTVGPSANFLHTPVAHNVYSLTKQEIQDIIEDYKQATRRAIIAGFDGIEISSAQKLLPQEFFSSFSNKRLDNYSSLTLENRSRFLIDIFQGVKQVIEELQPDNFIVGYRCTPEETRGEDLGYRIEDFLAFINLLLKSKIKIDYLAIASWGRNIFLNKVRSKGRYYNQLINKVVYEFLDQRIPLIVSGSINSKQKIEQAIAYGDFVGLSSAFVSDPELVTKIRDNQEIKLDISTDELEGLAIPQSAFQNIFQYFSYGESLTEQSRKILDKNSKNL